MQQQVSAVHAVQKHSLPSTDQVVQITVKMRQTQSIDRAVGIPVVNRVKYTQVQFVDKVGDIAVGVHLMTLKTQL